jgi:hypothetical protein
MAKGYHYSFWLTLTKGLESTDLGVPDSKKSFQLSKLDMLAVAAGWQRFYLSYFFMNLTLGL